MFSGLEEREKEELLVLLEKLCRDWEQKYPDTEEKNRRFHHR